MNSSKPEASSRACKPAFRSVAENLYRREPSGGYYAVVKKGGKQIWKSLKTKDRKLAERRLRDFIGQASNLRPQDDPHIPFPALADRWLGLKGQLVKPSTLTRAKLCIKALSPFFAGVSVRNIGQHHCELWVRQRGANIAAQTFAHELETMRAVFNYSMEIGLRADNPAAHIRRKPIRARRVSIPTRSQFKQLIAAIRASDGRPDSIAKSKQGADFVELLAYSGCRLDEARNLRWRDVDFAKDVFTVTGGDRGTKNHEPRTVPMNDALRGLLKRLHAEASPAPDSFVINTKSARKCIETAARRLGFPHFSHHAFRHFFATTAIESGGDIPTVARMLGHKDGGALLMKTYGHLRQEHAFTVAKRINFGTE